MMDQAQKEKLFQLAGTSYQKAMESMLGKSCQILLKRMEVAESNLLTSRFEDNQIMVKADFTGEMSGLNLYIFPKEIFTLIPEGTAEGQEELAMSSLSELVSMMVGGFCTAMKQKVNLSYNAPNAGLLEKDRLALPSTNLQLINYGLKCEESDLSWWQIVEEVWVESLHRNGMRSNQASMQGVDFPQFDIAHLNPQEQKNLGLLMDVPMVVTVELGRTRWQLRDVLTIGEGSIIELDKQAGEQVDILVNNNLVARGEVVVVDENFSVRITEIISNIEQMMQRIE